MEHRSFPFLSLPWWRPAPSLIDKNCTRNLLFDFKHGASVGLCWWAPGLHVTIAVSVAGCSVNGACVGLVASRHVLDFIFSDEAGARTGKDSDDFLWSVHLAPFIQTKCLLQCTTLWCVRISSCGRAKWRPSPAFKSVSCAGGRNHPRQGYAGQSIAGPSPCG
jgi:hypothetical protein